MSLAWLRRLIERRYCSRCGKQLQWFPHSHSFNPLTGQPRFSGFLYCPDQGHYYTRRINIDGGTRWSDDHDYRSLSRQPTWSKTPWASEGSGGL